MLNLETENKYFDLGYDKVAGLDEAGRGPLAGPVVAAAVVIDKSFQFDEEKWKLLNDSKKISAKKRELLFKIIKDNCLAVAIGVVSSKVIDEINILQASFLAMKKAVDNLKIKPNYCLIDGKFTIPRFKHNQKAIIGGDGKVFSIAAASIIAKVSRDYIMEKYHDKYPKYEFNRHKAYGTKLHLEKIKEFGPCAIHRLSFAPFAHPLSKKHKGSVR
jgi:ribonuclease HII